MEVTQPIDIYAYHLGTLVGNLHSLEVALHVALSKGNWVLSPDLSTGQEVGHDAVNQWAYLPNLVQRYNEAVEPLNPEWVLARGEDIVQLRNALAHGIVIARSPQPPLRLIKFGKVSRSKDKALVEFSAEMTNEWLIEQRRLIWDAIRTVAEYLKHLGIGEPLANGGVRFRQRSAPGGIDPVMEPSSTKDFVIDRTWRGTGKGWELQIRHVPTGISVRREIGYKPEEEEQHRRELFAELQQKLRAYDDSQAHES